MLLHQVSGCTKLIVEAKDKHLTKLSSKLDNPDTAPKTYWSIINRLLNSKKIPIMPPVLIKNYRPISLLSIFSKVFERLIFNSLVNYFIENKLFTECQSGFIPGD